MTVISDRTRAEMEAGALAVAKAAGKNSLPPGYMEALLKTQDRHKLFRQWEREGKIHVNRVATHSPYIDPSDGMPPVQWRTVVRVLSRTRKEYATFTDEIAEAAGGFPSEVLIANIALALSACGEI